MGNTCCNNHKKKKKIILLLVGLDNAGKSVTVKGLAGEPMDTVVPTVGLSVVYLKYKDCSVKVFDLGGGANIRGIWERYFMDVHGIIFVVDSSDYDRLEEAKKELEELLSHDKISGKPLLLLANKQDEQDALDEIDLVEKLQLEYLVNAKQCPTLVESCTATSASNSTKIDPGVKRGYYWLLNYILRNYQSLNTRVEMDVKQQALKDEQIRLERIERLKALSEEIKQAPDQDTIESFSDYDRKVNENISNQLQNGIRKNSSALSSFSHDNVSPLGTKPIETVPQVYYERINDFDLQERPKSAVQIIKQQLELDHSQKRRQLRPSLSNKTVPVNLYGVRHTRSAYDSRSNKQSFRISRQRPLKSASVCDESLITTDLPNSVFISEHNESEIHRELFQLNNFQKLRRLPPINITSKEEQKWVNRTNGISIIDI